MSIPQFPKNLGGAIDLSSLGKPKAAPSQGANYEVATAENFVPEFVAKSREFPVVVLVFSDRSPASVEIRDTFARIAMEDRGTWRFGAINLDTEPELIQALRVQAIPTAFVFIGEQALPLPEVPSRPEQIRALMVQIFQIAKDRGLAVEIPDAPEVRVEPEEEAALSAIESGDYSGAAMAYRNWLQREPSQPLAKIGLAQCELMARIAPLNPELTIQRADTNPAAIAEQMMAADIELSLGKHKEAFERLLNSIRRSKGEERDQLKSHLLELFQLVDPSDPDLVKARQSLASALF